MKHSPQHSHSKNSVVKRWVGGGALFILSYCRRKKFCSMFSNVCYIKLSSKRIWIKYTMIPERIGFVTTLEIDFYLEYKKVVVDSYLTCVLESHVSSDGHILSRKMKPAYP